MAKLILKVVRATSPYTATAQVEGNEASSVELHFNERSGSNGKAIIATLPKSLQALGTATNLSIQKAEFVEGATIERESVLGQSHAGATRGGAYSIEAKMEGNTLHLMAVARNGESHEVYSVENAALVKALQEAHAVNAYMQELLTFVNGTYKEFTQNVKSAETALRAIGWSEAQIKAELLSKQPVAPTFNPNKK